MAFRRFLPTCRAIVLVLLIAAVGPATSAQPSLTFSVDDVYGCRAGTRLNIDVHLDNPYDQISMFEIWLQFSRPDVFLFDTYEKVIYDTTYWYCITWDGDDCLDSMAVDPMQEWDWIIIDTVTTQAVAFDTTGTLLSGWGLVEARSLSGMGTDVRMAGISWYAGGPSWMDPQEGGTFFRLSGEIQDIPSFVEDSTALIMVLRNSVSQFEFVRPNGSIIGWNQVEVVDSTCFHCDIWEGDICLNWTIVPMGDPEDCDSIWVEHSTEWQLDTEDVVIDDGSVTAEVVMGDFDGGSQTENPDIADLVYLVTYMFQEGPPLSCPDNTDCDGNGVGPDIADLVCWVIWMFQTY